MPEIFQTSAIGAAATIGNSTNWLSNYAVSLFFPVISKLLGYYTFLPFAVFNLALGAIMFWILPETKGKSIDQVVRMLGVHQ